MAIPLRAISYAVLQDHGISEAVYNKDPEFSKSLDRIYSAIESYVEGKLSSPAMDDLMRLGVHSISEMYRLWLRSALIMGKSHSNPLLGRREQHPRLSIVAGFPSEAQPNVAMLSKRVYKETGVVPSGLMVNEPAFSIPDFLYDAGFGYGYDERELEILRKIALSRKKETVDALVKFCKNVDAYLSKRDPLDKPDLELVGLRNFVVDTYLVPFGVEEVHTISGGEFNLMRAIERNGYSFKIIPGNDEKKAGQPGYTILSGGNGVEVFHDSLYSDDISLKRVDGETRKELARISVKAGVQGRFKIDGDNPPFTSLMKDGLSIDDEKTFLHYAWELLESFASYDPNNPSSVWFPKSFPIAVEDPVLADFFDRMASIPESKKLNSIGKYARSLAYKYVWYAESGNPAKTLYDILVSEVQKSKNHQRTVLGNPAYYGHFLSQLDNAGVIKTVHEMLMSQQLAFDKLPDTGKFDEKERRLIESFSVSDRTDEKIIGIALEALREEKKRIEAQKPVFFTNINIGLENYADAGQKAYQAAKNGEKTPDPEIPQPPVAGSRLGVRRLRKTLHDACPGISDKIVSYVAELY